MDSAAVADLADWQVMQKHTNFEGWGRGEQDSTQVRQATLVVARVLVW